MLISLTRTAGSAAVPSAAIEVTLVAHNGDSWNDFGAVAGSWLTLPALAVGQSASGQAIADPGGNAMLAQDNAWCLRFTSASTAALPEVCVLMVLRP